MSICEEMEVVIDLVSPLNDKDSSRPRLMTKQSRAIYIRVAASTNKQMTK